MTSNKSALEQDTSGAPKFAPLLIGLLIVSLITLIVLAGKTSRNTRRESVELVQATQAFTAGQEMTVTTGNITISVPKYSLNLPGTISVTSQEPNLFPAADQPEWTRPQVIEVLFLNPQATPVPGVVFSKPVQICFTLSPEQWDDFKQRPYAYQVQYYAVENRPEIWQVLPLTSHDDLSMLCGETMHFSLFALAIRVDPNIPVTGLTETPTPTSVTPTAPGFRRTPVRTRIPPTNTLVSPSATSPVPTSTQPPPTATQPPPTHTEPPTVPPPTNTLVSPSATPLVPTSTQPPPTNTESPPADTDTPEPPADTETPSGEILPLPTLPLPTLPIGNP